MVTVAGPDGRGVCERWRAWNGHRRVGNGVVLTGPGQDLTLFIDGQSSQDEFFLYLPQQRIVEAKDVFEGAVRHPPLIPKPSDDP